MDSNNISSSCLERNENSKAIVNCGNFGLCDLATETCVCKSLWRQNLDLKTFDLENDAVVCNEPIPLSIVLYSLLAVVSIVVFCIQVYTLKKWVHVKRFFIIFLALGLSPVYAIYKLGWPERAQFGEDVFYTLILAIALIAQSFAAVKYENRFLRYMSRCLFSSPWLKYLVEFTHRTQKRLTILDVLLFTSWVPFIFVPDDNIKKILYTVTFVFISARFFYHAFVLLFVSRQYLADMKNVLKAKESMYSSAQNTRQASEIRQRIPGIIRARILMVGGFVTGGVVFLIPAINIYGCDKTSLSFCWCYCCC